ncbi:MAG: hypothetical protein ACPGNV_10165 [Mangrovicoccus sp.]
MRFVILTAALCLPQMAAAQDFSAVVTAVKELCSMGSSESGSASRLEVAGQANGEVKVKLIGSVGLAGEVTLTEEEWDGVQQVTKPDQLAENDGRRACVTALTPQFLAKMN